MTDGDETYIIDDREVVITGHMHVCCDGGNGQLGHPLEYLTLARGGEVVCNYCSRRYVHSSSSQAGPLRQQAGSAS